MTFNMYLRSMMVLACVCGLLISSGCRKKNVTAPVNPSEIGNTSTLPERTDGEADRIPASELPSIQNVLFAYDSFQVTDSEVEKIKAVAEYMKSNGGTRLVCEGNCDERGTAEYNVSLGENRALAVRAYLIGLGIDGARMQTKSFGKEKPLDLGHDESAHAKNRRVEFALYRK